MVTEELRAALLERSGVSAVSLKRTGTRRLVLSQEIPVAVDATFDLRQATPLSLIGTPPRPCRAAATGSSG